MKIKKFFSFICCLFLAISCFAPCAFAKYPHDGEWIYLTLKSAPHMRLSLPSAHTSPKTLPFGTVVEEWACNGCRATLRAGDGYTTIFRARRYDDGSYHLLLQPPSSLHGVTNELALDEGPDSHLVHGWDKHGGANQRWFFEPLDGSLILFRLRNKGTGRYLTYTGGDQLSGQWWGNTVNQMWIKH